MPYHGGGFQTRCRTPCLTDFSSYHDRAVKPRCFPCASNALQSVQLRASFAERAIGYIHNGGSLNYQAPFSWMVCVGNSAVGPMGLSSISISGRFSNSAFPWVRGKSVFPSSGLRCSCWRCVTVCRLRNRRLRMTNQMATRRSKSTPRPTPTPVPILADSDMPALFWSVAGVGEDVEDVLVLVTLAMLVLLVLALVLVEEAEAAELVTSVTTTVMMTTLAIASG